MQRLDAPVPQGDVLQLKQHRSGLPQVGGDHLRVVPDLGRASLRDLLAELQHHDPVGDPHDQAHVVLDQQHGVAQVADLADQLVQLLLLRGVEAGRRLVQAEQFRLGGQRPGDLETALVAVRQVAGQVVGPAVDADEPEQLERLTLARPLLQRVPRETEDLRRRTAYLLRHPDEPVGRVDPRQLLRLDLLAVQPEQRAEHAGVVPRVGADHDVLERRHLREEPDVLERPGHAHPVDLVRLATGDPLVVELHRARRRLVDAGHDVEAGRLAGTVRADQPQDLALVEAEADVVERHHAAEPQRHVVDVEKNFRSARQTPTATSS